MNLTPSQEPVAWYGALGVLLNAILVAIFVFAPDHGLNLSGAEQGALGGVVNAAYLLVGAFITRQAVSPVAPPPNPSS